MDQPLSIMAMLDLSDETERQVCEAIRRMHTGMDSLFRRMYALRRDGKELVELAEWRGGGLAVVRWSLATLGLTWRDHKTLQAAEQAFLTDAQ